MVMEENKELRGTIEVPPHNSFYTKYKLYQVDDSELISTIQPSFLRDDEKDFTIVIRRTEYKDIASTVDVKYRGNSDVIATLQPVSSSFVNSTIEINPHNSMYTIADILPPPLLTKEFTTIKDATVRSGFAYQTLNYGTEPSMMTGYKNGEEFESYIAFDIQLPQNILIKDAQLKLYFIGNYTNGLKIKLYSVDRDWSEYALTYRNRPQKLNLVSDTYTVDYTDRSIVFNLKNEINAIYTNQKTSKGYVVVVEHNNTDNYISFYTKESLKLPKLIVDYYDTQVYSAGRGQINSTLFVYGTGKKEIGATITVHSDIGNHDLLSTLYVHRYEVPILKDLPMAITVTRNSINSNIIVAQRDKKDIMVKMRVAEKQANDLISTLGVTRNGIHSTIYVKHRNTINATIAVQKYGDRDTTSIIAVRRDSINSTIFVKERSYVNSVITVQKHEGSNIDSIVTVTRENIPATILVKERSYMNAVITVQKYDNLNVLSTITVTRTSIPATIFVKERDDLTSKITVAKNDENTLIGSITVTKDHVYSTITVKERAYLNSKITVRKTYQNEQFSIVTVSRNSVNATICVKERKDLDSQITVRRTEYNEVPSIIAISRDSVSATIFVKERKHIDATILVYRIENSELPSTLAVKRDNINATMVIKAPSDIESTMIVSKPELATRISVRVQDDEYLNAIMYIRTKDASDLISRLTVVREQNGAYYFIL
jgi:hypothetical protein